MTAECDGIEPGDVWRWADELASMIGRRPLDTDPLPLDGRIFMALWWLELMESVS